MTRLNRAIAAIAGTFLLGSGAAWAASTPTVLHHKIHRTAAKSKATAVTTTPTVTDAPLTAPAESAGTETASPDEQYRLKLSNLHTGESLDVVYRVGSVYVPEALEKLNYFLRDHNTQEVVHYDPKEFDVLHSVLAKLQRAGSTIDIVCGYRTPATNAALRHGSPSTGVAEHSQHMAGHAIDIRIPGVSTVALRDAALSLRAGGVGYYPIHQFVHVDVGPVRQWAYGAAPVRPGSHHRTSTGM